MATADYPTFTNDKADELIAQTRRIAIALEGGPSALTYDETKGEYLGVEAWLKAQADGLAYGVSIPRGSATALTKTGANAGIPTPVPSTIAKVGSDPYRGRGAFRFYEVNGRVDADGTPHVTAFRGDGRFRRDGSNGNVWILTPVLWVRNTHDSDGVLTAVSVSDTPLAGMTAQPQAYLPDGTLRPYMLYAKYAGSVYGGEYASVSGQPVKNRTVSHDSLIALCKNASTGYSAKSAADDWYPKTMHMLKYGVKPNTNTMRGCIDYVTQCKVTAAGTDNSVTVAAADAKNLLVGSSVMVGTAATASGRGSSNAYDVTDAVRIVSIGAADSSGNCKVTLDCGAITTAVGNYVSTAPWHTGACDAVEGDGSPTGNTSGREPFVIQGIELMVGLYEVVGDVILSSDGSGFQVCVNHDSRSESTKVTDAYSKTGLFLPSAQNWQTDLACAGGMYVPKVLGGSATTGYGDYLYKSDDTVVGTREWLGFGAMVEGGSVGLWVLRAGEGLGTAWWGFGSRLSATGRSRG